MTITMRLLTLALLLQGLSVCLAFTPNSRWKRPSSSQLAAAAATTTELLRAKEQLLGLVRAQPVEDDVLADPVTKQGLCISTSSTVMGGDRRSKVKYQLQSNSNTFAGSSDTFFNLLEPIQETGPSSSNSSDDDDNNNNKKKQSRLTRALQRATPLIPPPLRSALATAGVNFGANYIPMRDLFTSPSVSFAYERGWRQGFVAAGFPGPDREAEMAMEYFAPVMARSPTKVLVDMSCATGLFTRRFAKSGNYKRVLGCDYSKSMLTEARRRIVADRELSRGPSSATKLDLVRLDVGCLPMKNNSVDAMNAGAAMHCWPDLPAAASEIYRVLKPGGRYFATTFLSSYFGTLQAAEGGANGPSRQAFQYFESVDQLRSLLESGGFARDKIFIEVLGNACVVIRCEK